VNVQTQRLSLASSRAREVHARSHCAKRTSLYWGNHLVSGLGSQL